VSEQATRARLGPIGEFLIPENTPNHICHCADLSPCCPEFQGGCRDTCPAAREWPSENEYVLRQQDGPASCSPHLQRGANPLGSSSEAGKATGGPPKGRVPAAASELRDPLGADAVARRLLRSSGLPLEPGSPARWRNQGMSCRPCCCGLPPAPPLVLASTVATSGETPGDNDVQNEG